MPGIHAGHRERMRERYRLCGADSLQTHELLEILLYHVIPQKDTNPLAHALLDCFGSIDGVFSATKEDLTSVFGAGDRIAEFLIQNGRAAYAIANAPLWESPAPVYDNYEALGNFLVSYFSENPHQATVALLFDSGMKLLALTELAALDFGSAGVRADRAVERAIALGASVAVLSHNHPHGPAYPSHSDIVSQQALKKSLSACGLLLLEHYVVAGKSFVGFGSQFGVEEPLGEAIQAFIDSKEEAKA